MKMTASFGCPYCDKQYPNNPLLIGRKVRCSGCKNVFQLQGDGTVEKIEIAAQKPQAGESTGSTSRTDLAQPLTSRQKSRVKKNITKRIEKSRSALRDAANEAIAAQSKEQQNVSEALEAKNTEHKSTHELEVHLSGSNASAAQAKKIMLLVSAVFSLALIIYLLNVEPTPERAALNAFAQSIEDPALVKYPHRMLEYRSRMWLYTRDGVDLPPIILNANKASLSDSNEVDWAQIIQTCKKYVDGMSLMPLFGIFVHSDRQASVERMWKKYPYKHDVSSFYNLLKKNEVKFLACNKLPDLLAKDGLSPRDVYLVSLLLAGTLDKDGNPSLDFGILSSYTADKAFVSEFAGQRGVELVVERAEEYAISMAEQYCGMIVGFTGMRGSPDEWRVLDIRLGESMSQYYEEKFNPLVLLRNKARVDLRKKFPREEKALNPQNINPEEVEFNQEQRIEEQRQRAGEGQP